MNKHNIAYILQKKNYYDVHYKINAYMLKTYDPTVCAPLIIKYMSFMDKLLNKSLLKLLIIPIVS